MPKPPRPKHPPIRIACLCVHGVGESQLYEHGIIEDLGLKPVSETDNDSLYLLPDGRELLMSCRGISDKTPPGFPKTHKITHKEIQGSHVIVSTVTDPQTLKAWAAPHLIEDINRAHAKGKVLNHRNYGEFYPRVLLSRINRIFPPSVRK